MFQIVTDSCCDLPYRVLAQNQVAFMSMMIQIEDQEYADDLGENFDYNDFLEKIRNGAQPTTSQINVGRYLEFFKPYVEKHLPVLYLAFSSGLSGSYQSACQAVQMLSEEYDRDPEIHVIDTKAASLGQGLLVLKACELRDQKKDLQEIIATIENVKMKVQSWVTVDDLDHLQRGGRISKAAAAFGGLMNVKPIINVDADGKLQNVGKVRGRNKALQKIADETAARIAEPQEQQLLIAYAGDLASAEKTRELLLNKIAVKEITLYPLGPTITSHTGYGCVAVFSFGESRK